MQRYDHKYTHKYKSYLVSFILSNHKYMQKSHTSIDTFLPKVFMYTQVQITSFMSSNWQLTGTCNSQVHILVKSKVHATFNYILVKSKVHLKKSTSQVQPGIYTKAKSKTKNKKNHAKNMLEKRLKKITFQCKLNLHWNVKCKCHKLT